MSLYQAVLHDNSVFISSHFKFPSFFVLFTPKVIIISIATMLIVRGREFWLLLGIFLRSMGTFKKQKVLFYENWQKWEKKQVAFCYSLEKCLKKTLVSYDLSLSACFWVMLESLKGVVQCGPVSVQRGTILKGLWALNFSALIHVCCTVLFLI